MYFGTDEELIAIDSRVYIKFLSMFKDLSPHIPFKSMESYEELNLD